MYDIAVIGSGPAGMEAAFVAGFFNYTNRWVSTIAPVANPGHFSHNRNFED